MTTINIYLTFNGNCEEAFLFYESVLGGKADIKKFKDMPDDPAHPLTAEEKEKVMHVHLPVNETTVILGSDTGGAWAGSFVQGNNFSVSLNADSRSEADRLFNGLSKDGTVMMPMSDTFWDSYFGMFTDKFGVQWMISYDKPDRKK